MANDEDKRPILISTSPQDDSTRVPIDSDIILTFNKDVNCESGTINIESEDNSSSFAVSLPNQIVSGVNSLVEQCYRKGNTKQKQKLKQLYYNLTVLLG